jgi:hypothetical protein
MAGTLFSDSDPPENFTFDPEIQYKYIVSDLADSTKRRLKMSKAKNPAIDIAYVPVKSFKDAAYQSALQNERSANVARYVLDNCPEFLDNVPQDIEDELNQGFAQRWQDTHEAKTYNAEWVPVENGGFSVTLDYCLSYSQQAFGRLKTEDPILHGIIKNVRDPFNKYKSARMKDLKMAVSRLVNEGKPKERNQAKDFIDWADDMFDTMKTRCKTAKARNDATANEVQLRLAIDAFKKTYKV